MRPRVSETKESDRRILFDVQDKRRAEWSIRTSSVSQGVGARVGVRRSAATTSIGSMNQAFAPHARRRALTMAFAVATPLIVAAVTVLAAQLTLRSDPAAAPPARYSRVSSTPPDVGNAPPELSTRYEGVGVFSNGGVDLDSLPPRPSSEGPDMSISLGSRTFSARLWADWRRLAPPEEGECNLMLRAEPLTQHDRGRFAFGSAACVRTDERRTAYIGNMDIVAGTGIMHVIVWNNA
ncbi:hypothetical protein [Actinomadura fibrosa]|uniref:Uncharacterized protein n=1 Tax=Actinomadura fibrosa TaxID=111802 RepID=A0ABW2XYL3_9ACTN|nr:hypothetical protein [Actinomadura fibrosa]